MYAASLVDIVLFVNIAEAESLTGGAQRSYMSLPAASMRMKTLEERLGTKLFSRTSQGITLTRAGQAFLNHGLIVLKQMNCMAGDLREYASGVKGHIRVFANSTCINELLPPLVTEYLACNPDITINLEEHMSPEIVHALSEGIADIGIIAGDVQTTGLEARSFRRYSMVVIASLDHPLAGRACITTEEALDYEHVGLLQGSASHSCISQVAYLINKPLKVRIHVSNFEVLATMVAANVGIGILSASAAGRYARTMPISVIPITDEWAMRDTYICVKSMNELPHFARDLIDLLANDRVLAVAS